jgi:hypothetical protein
MASFLQLGLPPNSPFGCELTSGSTH